MNLDRRLLSLLRHTKPAFVLSVVLGVVGGALAVWQAWLLARAINAAFLLGHARERLGSVLALLLGVILVRAVVAFGAEAASSRVALRIKNVLRDRLVDRVVSRGPCGLRTQQSGELVHVLVDGVEAVDAYFSQYLPQLILAVAIPLTVLAVVFPLDLLSGVVLVITAPLIPLFMVLIGRVANARTQVQWQALGRMGAYFLDVLQGLTTLKLLGRSRQECERVERVGERYRRTTMEVLRVTFLSALVLELLTTLSTAVVAVEIGLRLLYNRLEFEQAFVILLLAPEFYLPLRMLGARFHAGMSGAAAANRIFAILEAPGTAYGKPDAAADIAPGPIKLHGVTVRHGNREHAALDNVSLRIEAGRHTVIVGPTGSGKSTLVNLLMCFMEPDEGAITVNGKALKGFGGHGWRNNVAWVPQHPFLFHDTVEANIRLARPTATREQVIHAACLAEAHAFIQELPDGYNTVVGEQGTRLSGGQAQRIALARMFLKDAPLLILDEATSHLDAETEARVLRNLASCSQGRTVLTITHRGPCIALADHVVVLEQGRVVERDTHVDTCSESFTQVEFQANEPNTVKLPGTALVVDDGRNTTFPRFAVLHRLLGLTHPSLPNMGVAVLLGTLTVLASVGLMSTATFIIATAALHPSIAELQVAIVGVRFFGLVRGVFRYLERLVSHDVTLRLLARLRAYFYSALELLAPARLTWFRSGDLLSRMVADINSLEGFYVRALAPPLVALGVVSVTVWSVSAWSLSMAAVILVMSGLAGVVGPWIVRALGKSAGRSVVRATSAFTAQAVDLFQGLADVMAWGGTSHHVQHLKEKGSELVVAQARLAWTGALHGGFNTLLSQVCMWWVLVLGIPLVSQGQLGGVALAVLVMVAVTVFESVQPLGPAAQHLESHLQAGGRLLEVVDAEPSVRNPDQPANPPVSWDLSVRGLCFRYHGGNTVLDGFDLDLPRGKRVAVVGPTGSGKTTLVNVFTRLWEFQAGEVLLGGVDLRSLPGDFIRQHISVVPQRAWMFAGTLRDNLLLVKPGAAEQDMERVARAARLHDFITSLPRGWDTWIGEHGLSLSGGERQRLAIARALLKDAPVILMDEPTTHLDPATAAEIMDELLTRTRDRALLLITHALTGLECMDEIVVLERGRVVERGRHGELLAHQGAYRALWNSQGERSKHGGEAKQAHAPFV